MKRIKCYDKNGDSINHLIQWDKNQEVYVDDLENGIIPRVHFSIRSDDKNCWEYKDVVSKGVFNGNTQYKITIPNALLDKGSDMTLFLYYDHGANIGDSSNEYTTEYFIYIPVKNKPKPDSFIYSDNVEYMDVYALKSYIDNKYDNLISQKGANNGVAELNENGTVPENQLPDYLVSVEKSNVNGNIKIDGEEVIVYIHPAGTNPHGLTVNDLNLENVDNTSDIDKPISNDTQEALDEINENMDKMSEKISALVVDGLSSDLEKLKTALIDVFYPVGTIYESVNNTNPSEFIGGTWESWGAGKVSVGVDENDEDFNTSEMVGGEKEHTLTVDEMPSHTHKFTGAATNHLHTIPALSGTAANVGLTGKIYNYAIQDHATSVGAYGDIVSVVNGSMKVGYGSTTTENQTTLSDTVQIDASHSHTVTTTASKTESASVTASGSNSNTGSGQAHNNLQPYITSYKWKRIA